MWLIILVTIIFAAVCAIIVLDPFNFPKGLIYAVLPLATFALFYIAVLTILSGRIKEKQRRKQSVLIEIDEWARDGHKILSGYLPIQTLQGRNDSLRLIAGINTRKYLMAKSAKSLNSNLSEDVMKAVEDIDFFVKQLEAPIEDLTSDGIEYTNIGILQEQCDKSLIQVFESTSLLRAKLRI